MPTTSVHINDEKFNSKDVVVYLFGRIVPVKKINHNQEKDVAGVYVTGNDKPVGYVKGNQKANGSISLLLGELMGLELSLGKNIVDAGAFNIVVVVNKPGGIVLQKVYRTCIPIGSPHDWDADQTDASVVNIPLWIGDVTPWKP